MSTETSPAAHELTPPRPSTRRAFWLGVGIVLVTAAVFYPVLTHWFVYWDDDFFILRNTDIDPPTWKSLARFWANPVEGYNQFLVPVNYTVWWLLAQVARTPATAEHSTVFNAHAFHALNLSFHLIASALAFGLLRKLVKSDWAAAAGALSFAINPLQAEPVSWASNMYTPLSGALALGALLAYLSSTDEDRSRRGKWTLFVISTLCYVLALLSKPSIVLLPLIASAIQILLRRKSLRQCLPLLAWVIIGGLDAWLTHHIHKGASTFQPPPWQRLFVAGDALAFYLGKLIAPFSLIPDYGRSPQFVLRYWTTYLIWIFPAAALTGCWTLRRRFPWLMCGATIFVLGVFPMLGLVPFDFQGFSTVADRYLYLSLLGGALVVAFALKNASPLLAQTRWRSPALATVIGALLVLTTVCRAQVNYWQDTGTLFHRTLAVNPKSEVAHLQLGYVLLNRGGQPELEEALFHYTSVLETRPHDPPLLCNIALCLRKLGRPAEALPYLREAAELAPKIPMPHYMIADTLVETGNQSAALAKFIWLFQRLPEYNDVELRVARLMAETGNAPGALSHYRNYLLTHPNSRESRAALARLASAQPQQAATDGR
jgi:tetratricopeptide (TPR) repeat protein